MTIVVNFLGGPGTGKSTTAADLFAQLKQRGASVELVREYAKDVVWEGRLHLLSNQIYIFAKQLKMQVDLMGKVDYIVTDSPLLLSIIYGDGGPLDELVLSEYNKFDNINIMLERVKPFQQAGRLQNEVEARDIDFQIREMLNNHNLPYHHVVADANAATHVRKSVLMLND